MDFLDTEIIGCKLIKLSPFQDDRGTFARVFCSKEFEEQSLKTEYVQSNISTNNKRGVLRGMHFQNHPHEEVKLVRAFKGAIFDVVVDLRKNSKTYLSWFGAELSEANGLMMYVPEGCGHGYLSLTDKSLVHYMVSSYYHPSAESGFMYNDPLIKIEWPIPIKSISKKDKNWKPLENL